MPLKLPPTKVSPPAADVRQVLRLHLVETMVQAPTVRLVVVKAPAGFGKTTLMAQARNTWRNAGVATAWLTLDAAENDTSRFVSCLTTALDELSGEDAAGHEAWEGTSTGELALAAIERFAAIDFPFVLFLDEFEAIRSDGVISLVHELIARLPWGAKLIIGTRTESPLRLAKLRATGQLLEIDSRDLRFTLKETLAFFEQRTSLNLSNSDLTSLHAKTDGWVTAVWLAWLALERSQDRGKFIGLFSGSEAALAAYLAEEVLSKQSTVTRKFLVRTSVLEELSPRLCQALVPDVDARAVLRELAADGLFLIPIENEPDTWKYHSLFADFLRAELANASPSLVQDLHKLAAQAYQELGRTIKAIDHLILGGHIDDAVTLLDQHALALLNQGRLRLLARWFDAIPAQALAGAPMLQVVHTWTVSYTRGPRAAQSLLESAQRCAADHDTEIQTHLAALQVTLFNQLDRWEEAYALGSDALRKMEGQTHVPDAALVNVVASSATVLGRFNDAKRMVERSRQSQAQSNSSFQRMYGESVEGIVDMLGGRFRQAQARFRLALQASQAERVGAPHGNAWAGLLYAASIYERGDIQQARQLLHVYVPLCQEAWLSDHTIVGHQQLARIAFHDGDVEHAFELISHLESLGHQRQISRFIGAARLERAHILLRQGHAQAAADELTRAAELPIWRDIASRSHLAHDWDDVEIGKLRWQIVFGDAQGALTRLNELESRAQELGQGRRLLKIAILSAMATLFSGDVGSATARTQTLLREMFREGAARVLIDEGAPAAMLLEKVLASTNTAEDVLFTEYLHSLQLGFSQFDRHHELDIPDNETGPILEPLTPKEIQLLGLVSEGYSNKALAEKLFISLSTVCTHMRNINVKLGTHNRTQAVATGRRHGLVR